MTSFPPPADELEYAVLTKVWELGAASVRELHEHLGEPAGGERVIGPLLALSS
jgi:hypothetical protein